MFKDIQTRQTIGYGVKRGKLYYLDLDQINIEVDELEPSGSTLDQCEKEKEHQKGVICVKSSLSLTLSQLIH